MIVFLLDYACWGYRDSSVIIVFLLDLAQDEAAIELVRITVTKFVTTIIKQHKKITQQ